MLLGGFDCGDLATLPQTDTLETNFPSGMINFEPLNLHGDEDKKYPNITLKKGKSLLIL